MTMPAMPQQKAHDAARAAISAEARERALERAMRRWAELTQEQDDALLSEGFGLFSKADAQAQKDAFMSKTDERDIWRCLLNEDYVDEWEEGLVMAPYSDFWRTLLEIGGRAIFKRFAGEFRRAWNRAAREAGLPDLIYSPNARESSETY